MEYELDQTKQDLEMIEQEKKDVEIELAETQVRNDELNSKLLTLEEELEEVRLAMENTDKDAKLEVFELEQKVNTLEDAMSRQEREFAKEVQEKDEKITKLKGELEFASTQKEDPLIPPVPLNRETTSTSLEDYKLQGQILQAEGIITQLLEKVESLESNKHLELVEMENKELHEMIEEMEQEIKELNDKHQEELDDKDETIKFFQDQVVFLKKGPEKKAGWFG